MADILDAAKKTDDPAKSQDVAGDTAGQSPPGAPLSEPAVPASAVTPAAEPVSTVPPPLAASVEPPLSSPAPSAVGNPEPMAEPAVDASKVMDSVLGAADKPAAGTSPAQEVNAQPPAQSEPTLPPPAKPKKGVGKSVILSVLLLLLITLPLIIYYTSQQRQIAEIRSRATGPYGNHCDRSSPNTADCTDKSAGSACTRRPEYGGGSGTCQQLFSDPFGANMECECAVSGETPPPTLPPGTGTPPPAGTGTPPPGTPTQPPGPQCQNIKIYKAGQALSAADLANLKPGDNFNIVIIGAGATKARARVNGGDWTETTDIHAITGGFRVPFTIPEGVTNFSIESEAFINGAWH